MLSPLRNRFGIPGVISVIALVFAMLGGAYAASDDGGSGKATASAKAKKGPRGPRGPKGPKGPAGPAGPQGPAGPAGAKGDKGDTGAAGSNGSNGAAGPIGPTGPTGKTGPTGQDGQTGFTETLPPGKTETGTWAVGIGPEFTSRLIPISFNIRLAAPLTGTHVHYINEAGEEVPNEVKQPPTTCDGTAAAPTADPGHLCIYTGSETAIATTNEFITNASGAQGASTAGAIMRVFTSASSSNGFGTWAVTAEEE